jgi:hypothetical protein
MCHEMLTQRSHHVNTRHAESAFRDTCHTSVIHAPQSMHFPIVWRVPLAATSIILMVADIKGAVPRQSATTQATHYCASGEDCLVVRKMLSLSWIINTAELYGWLGPTYTCMRQMSEK